MLDSVAKIRRTFLGSRSHEEGRLKLFLRVIHLLSAVGEQMLLAVMVIWWWTCGFEEFCVDPNATTVDFSPVQDPSRAAFGEHVVGTVSLSWSVTLPFAFLSPPRWDPFLERLRCNVVLELALVLSLLMPEEKESISITKLSTFSGEYWYAFMWSETEILWVSMFFFSDSKASQEEPRSNSGISAISITFQERNRGIMDEEKEIYMFKFQRQKLRIECGTALEISIQYPWTITQNFLPSSSSITRIVENTENKKPLKEADGSFWTSQFWSQWESAKGCKWHRDKKPVTEVVSFYWWK